MVENEKTNFGGVKVYAVILIVVLAVVLTLMSVFIVLYFGEKAENEKLKIETQAQTQTHTQEQATEETQEKTEKETEKPKEKKTQQAPVFDAYTLKVYAPVDIYSGPGYHFSYVDSISEDGVYTIVDEHSDSYYNNWGKLKSGVGWIELKSATTKVQTYNYVQEKKVAPKSVPYTMKIYLGTAIYPQPSYSSEPTACIEEEGVYTIVQESYDDYGNKWGKLKSGIGWIELYE